MTSVPKSVSIVAFAFTLGWAPGAVRAFCRTTTEPMSAACPSPCPSGGVPLAWGTPEIEYAFNRDSFIGASGMQLRAAIVRAFQRWAEVKCSGQAIGFTFVQGADTPQTLEPNQLDSPGNVITELPADEWAALQLDPHAFAKTQLWYDKVTGEIVNADIAFNGALGSLTACPDTGCPADAIDLENVATHELGHFLGLAHSADSSATMWCDAVKGDLQKRTLAADDEAGLCSIYGSRTVFFDPGSGSGKSTADGGTSSPKQTTSSAGCSLSGAERPGRTLELWLLSGVALLFTRKKYRTR